MKQTHAARAYYTSVMDSVTLHLADLGNADYCSGVVYYVVLGLSTSRTPASLLVHSLFRGKTVF